jgi:serine/threonine-protein kinase
MSIPPALNALVLECLAKEPAHRPGTADALARRLEAIELENSWTGDRAAQWWKTHLPAT